MNLRTVAVDHDRLVKLQPASPLVFYLQLELKKTVVDRMVHLLSKGCVLPVVSYMRTCWQRGDTDISLIRHFVTEVR